MKLQWLLLLLFSCFASCKKFLHVNDPSQGRTELLFNSDSSATAVINGIYIEMMTRAEQFTAGKTSLFAGLAADELIYYSPGFRDDFTLNNISPQSATVEVSFWQACYRYIHIANLAIERLAHSSMVNAALKGQLTGEAKFIRAFCYFYLANFFGDVPLVLAGDHSAAQSIPRTAASRIYQQMIEDLKDAMQLLPIENSSGRIRPQKFAAAALLSRCYLYLKQWNEAATFAGFAIDAGPFRLEQPDNVFLSTSRETIWQLLPVVPQLNTFEAFDIIPATPGTTPTYILNADLFNSIDSHDLRRVHWIKSRTYFNQSISYPYKYKVKEGSIKSEYNLVLRLAELHLIRAEARAELNQAADALDDLNRIRARAGLLPVVTTDKQELLKAISRERRIELFGEWGHRWFDLIRSGAADSVLRKLKPGTWQVTDQLWPIPERELRHNPALIQNPGY
jgi:starch-binding outer membrane protein, SusD/RagB family